MSKIQNNLREVKKLNELQQREGILNGLHPVVKLVTTILYILVLVSFPKYQVVPCFVMCIYLILLFSLGDLSIRDGIRRMKLILPLVCVVGIFNPSFDHTPITRVGGYVLTGGMLSMLSLMMKGIYAVLASYLLIATTSIEDICYALRCFHVPKILVTVILLIDRYFFILGEEAGRMMDAYKLRAPKQNGIHYKAWGPLVGQWLLRSMDRAEMVYESMSLRGFQGEFRYGKRRHFQWRDFVYLMAWVMVFWLLRFTNILEWIG
ncbi:MAG: cobalt ECF transporter T component CbiQ [Lachnospiraceae bacterium]|nr:cobalt ECF transporter T component CbiQ [Lachnospiraceae bacterium]